jgi:hypothetical protein
MLSRLSWFYAHVKGKNGRSVESVWKQKIVSSHRYPILCCICKMKENVALMLQQDLHFAVRPLTSRILGISLSSVQRCLCQTSPSHSHTPLPRLPLAPPPRPSLAALLLAVLTTLPPFPSRAPTCRLHHAAGEARKSTQWSDPTQLHTPPHSSPLLSDDGRQLPRPMREGMRIGRWKLLCFESIFSLSFLHRGVCSMEMKIIARDGVPSK